MVFHFLSSCVYRDKSISAAQVVLYLYYRLAVSSDIQQVDCIKAHWPASAHCPYRVKRGRINYDENSMYIFDKYRCNSLWLFLPAMLCHTQKSWMAVANSYKNMYNFWTFCNYDSFVLSPFRGQMMLSFPFLRIPWCFPSVSNEIGLWQRRQ